MVYTIFVEEGHIIQNVNNDARLMLWQKKYVDIELTIFIQLYKLLKKCLQEPCVKCLVVSILWVRKLKLRTFS